MTHVRLQAAIAALVCVVLFAPASTYASPITVVDGTPVVFAGMTVSHGEERLDLKLDWVGIASDLDWRGGMFRVGAAASPNLPGILGEGAAYSFGIGAQTAKMFSLVAAVEGSSMLYLQDLGDGPVVAFAGRATGATARIGINTDFGAVPVGFDVTPARLIGQDFWPDRPGLDLAGKGWINLTAALQSSRTRTDSVRLGYIKELGDSGRRADIGYALKYSPEGLGIAIKLYSGVALGAPSVTLLSELGFRADVTDDAGAEVCLAAQTGGASEHVWLSGSCWLGIGDKADVKVTVSAPVVGGTDYVGPELFRPVDSAAMTVGVDFAAGFLSSISARYDFRTKDVGLEFASRF